MLTNVVTGVVTDGLAACRMEARAVLVCVCVTLEGSPAVCVPRGGVLVGGCQSVGLGVCVSPWRAVQVCVCVSPRTCLCCVCVSLAAGVRCHHKGQRCCDARVWVACAGLVRIMCG